MTVNIIRSRVAFTLAAVLVAAGFGIPALVEAQQSAPPLAEVAKKEAERRKATKETKVLTNKDLPESAIRPKPSPSDAAPATGEPAAAPAADGHAQTAASGTPAAAAAPAAGAPAGRQGDEAAWRGRIEQARETLRRNEMFAQALQTRINSLTNDFGGRDDPYQRARIAEERSKTIEELGRVKTDVEQGRKQIADIEEEARKAGVPPGWLR
jgi:hypothetical protein